jgi:23S rRNA (cytidine1920-2'-O)/16S rRNA (cytidine1409-2'-O)-methyltransferase
VTSHRLDEALVARGLVTSRSRARDAILRGTVRVDGEPARKPSQTVSGSTVLSVDDEAQRYVSRAALKLLHALKEFSITPKDRICIDLGASTGGFTQVLLEQGAAHVIAIDVGHDQMVEHLRLNTRVTNIEGLNGRDITRDVVPDDTTLVVCDVSFISLKLALLPLLDFLPSQAELIALIKPQFEVGKANLGKGGVVRDHSLLDGVCDDIVQFLKAQNWIVKGVVPSPLEGGDGNVEFLLHAIKSQ